MSVIRISFLVLISIVSLACGADETVTAQKSPSPTPASKTPIATTFAYPIGNTETVTQTRDKDEWYNALDFGQQDHLGEDWNKMTGGNTDCGEPVYAAGDGTIKFAVDAGPGWGNVVIIEHTLSSGEKMESLYGHLSEMLKTSGEVKKRERIGSVGNANRRYSCHLHFEMRRNDCTDWGKAGGGYSAERKGWVDPSDFIDSTRKQPK